MSANDARLQDALTRIYDTPERPRCMCAPGGIDMYVAKHRQYIIKRMPGTGGRHHPSCAAYELEFAQSGLGALMGDSVIEHSPESIELRVAFPLTRVPRKAILCRDATSVTETNESRHLMSLRAVAHFLFERAGFNRWAPAMEGKRSQGVLHKYLMEAAEEIETKGVRLTERLYIPEQFSEQRKSEIAHRRREKLSILQAPDDEGKFKMVLVMGEFKGVEASTFGRKVWIKHMPDAPLLVDTQAWGRIERAYGDILEARDSDTSHKLRVVICALVYAKRERIYQVDAASLMLTTEHWIPIEGLHEVDLIHALIDQKRRFVKPLRYDARSAASFANALLLDTGESPTPLHVVSGFMASKDRTAKEKVIRAVGCIRWVWNADKAMPVLPAVTNTK